MTRHTHRKSYLVIIYTHSREKLTKVKLGQIGVGSNILLKITCLAYMKSYLVIICPISHEKLIKVILGQSLLTAMFDYL